MTCVSLSHLRLMQLSDDFFLCCPQVFDPAFLSSIHPKLPSLSHSHKTLLKMKQLDDDFTIVRDIPRVKSLCETLGIEADKSCYQFRDSLIRWRSNYRTASGRSGMEIIKWTSQTDRYELGVMAQKYLEHLEIAGRARECWPSNGQASPRPRPEYPKDEKR